MQLFENEILLKHYMVDLEILLKNGESYDLNGIELFDELKIFYSILNKQKTSIISVLI